MGGPYLGDKIVWEFASDEERALYRALSKPALSAANVLGIGAIVALNAVFWYTTLSKVGAVIVTAGVFVPALTLKIFVRRFRMQSLELQLRPGYFSLYERRDSPFWLRAQRIGPFKAGSIATMDWLPHGCHIEAGRRPFFNKTVVLPLRLFSTLEAVNALYRWGDEHGIEIKGPPPLEGGYIRPVGGPERG